MREARAAAVELREGDRRAVLEAHEFALAIALRLAARELDERPAFGRPIEHRHPSHSRSARPAATIAAASRPAGIAPKRSARAGAGRGSGWPAQNAPSRPPP